MSLLQNLPIPVPSRRFGAYDSSNSSFGTSGLAFPAVFAAGGGGFGSCGGGGGFGGCGGG